MLIIQSDFLNDSRIATLLCVPLTSNLKWANAPSNVLLRAIETGLPRDSIAIVTQVAPINRSQFIEHVGEATRRQLALVLDGLDSIVGR